MFVGKIVNPRELADSTVNDVRTPLAQRLVFLVNVALAHKLSSGGEVTLTLADFKTLERMLGVRQPLNDSEVLADMRMIYNMYNGIMGWTANFNREQKTLQIERSYMEE